MAVSCIAGWQPAGRRCFQGERIVAALSAAPGDIAVTGLRYECPPLPIAPETDLRFEMCIERTAEAS